MGRVKLDVRGLTRAAVLAAFYNAAQPAGKGHLVFEPGDIAPEMADKIIQLFGGREIIWIDYLIGRLLKIEFQGDALDVSLFDHNYGAGAGERVLAALRASQSVERPEA